MGIELVPLMPQRLAQKRYRLYQLVSYDLFAQRRAHLHFTLQQVLYEATQKQRRYFGCDQVSDNLAYKSLLDSKCITYHNFNILVKMPAGLEVDKRGLNKTVLGAKCINKESLGYMKIRAIYSGHQKHVANIATVRVLHSFNCLLICNLFNNIVLN